MRLIDIKRSVNIAFGNFEIKNDSSNGNYYIRNIQKLKIALTELSKIQFIVLENQEIYRLITNSVTDVLIMDGNQYNKHNDVLVKLQFSIYLLHNWINIYVPTEETDEKIINIKLPNIDDLGSLSMTVSLLEESLSAISTINGGEVVRVKQLDHGSLWIIIAVCSIRIVKAIGKAAEIALEIAKKKVELDNAKEAVRRAKIQNDMIESLNKMHQAAINQILDEKATELGDEEVQSETGLSKTERIGRYKKVLKELTMLISAGTEFHPALLASQEIIDEFPNFKNQLEVKSAIAQLSNNDDSENKVNENKK